MSYTEVMTRDALAGCIDKLALIDSLAWKYATDAEFAQSVLARIGSSGSAADEQAAAWCTFVGSLPYRREPVEVFRDPKETMKFGGDCDDLTLLCVAGRHCLAIPALPEALCDEQGWAFHVRVLVGLPPTNPTVWSVVDPVWESERSWVMMNVPLSSYPLGRESIFSEGMAPSSTTSSFSTTTKVVALGALAFVGWRLLK